MHNHKYIKEIYFYTLHQKFSFHFFKKIPKMSKFWIFSWKEKDTMEILHHWKDFKIFIYFNFVYK